MACRAIVFFPTEITVTHSEGKEFHKKAFPGDYLMNLVTIKPVVCKSISFNKVNFGYFYTFIVNHMILDVLFHSFNVFSVVLKSAK